MIVSLQRCLLAVSAGIAIGAPLLLLRDEGGRPVAPVAVRLAQAAPLRDGRIQTAVLGRTLFAAAAENPPAAVAAAPEEEAERPELIGIVGRLPDDAVALVRAEDGRSRTIRAGQTFRGWRLASLDSDAALFVRGSERVRVGLDPVG